LLTPCSATLYGFFPLSSSSLSVTLTH
jgi:hypothetical protein